MEGHSLPYQHSKDLKWSRARVGLFYIPRNRKDRLKLGSLTIGIYKYSESA